MSSPASAGRPLLPRPLSVGLFALAAALLASALPLIAYAGSLALFGLPHVLAELRYVDGRFGRRLQRSKVLSLLVLLGLAVALRMLGMAGLVEPLSAYVAELGLVAVMAFLALPALTSSPVRLTVALLVGGLLAAGSWRLPLLTIVLLSVLHNLTPVGFLYERLWSSPWRRRLGLSAAILFLGVPLLLATGWPFAGLAALGFSAPELSFASVGPLTAHRGVFVPEGWFRAESATHVFGAVTYLQLMHYGAVLLVLPRLLGSRAGGTDRPLLPWPRFKVLVPAIAAVSLVAAVLFVQDFRGTRAAYGVLASVHAWIEIPVLLLALTPLPMPLPISPQ